MPRQTTSGFVGILLLTIVAIGVGVGYFLIQQRKIPEPVASSTEAASLGLVSVGESQLANVSQVEVTSTTSPKVPVEKKVEKLVQEKKNSSSVNTVNDSDFLPKKDITTKPDLPAQAEVLEPTLIIEAGEQPRQTLLLGDARLVPFTTFKLTAEGSDVTVNSLTVERKGFGSDKIFVEVGVIDHGTERKLNSNHQYVMNKPFTVKQGETEEITLYGNIVDATTLATYNGQAPSLALVAIKINSDMGAKVTGTLPIVGTMQTVNSSLVIGSITFTNSGFDPAVGRSLYINDKNVTFAGVRGTMNSAEPVLLKSFSWTHNGSASSLNMANVKICVVKVETRCYDAEVDSFGKYYTADFANDIKIEKGGVFDVYIKGDILPSGVNRTVNFDITTSYDITAYGLTYRNFFYPFGGSESGNQPEGSFSTTEFPFYNGYAHSIVGGSFNSIGR